MKGTRAKKETVVPRLHDALVLHRWLLGLIGVQSLEELAKLGLKDPELEHWDEERVSGFVRTLIEVVPERKRLLTDDELLEHDSRIWSHTQSVNERRNEPIRWKYFQYFALLLTDVYLSRWFADRQALCDALNTFIEQLNADEREHYKAPALEPTDLNKLAFWSATGSGKTLLMHVNLLQFRYYSERNGKRGQTARTLLITPNEGLSAQHLAELQAAGIAAEVFRKNGGAGLFGQEGRTVEIIEISKLAEEEGPLTVAVDSFEHNNLLLVDEAHRGTSAKEEGQWLQRRNQLCSEGFAFEYSATFGQAIRWDTKKNASNTLFHSYARGIAFDYSYKYFYRDGYGKDYSILNIDTRQETLEYEMNQLFLTACLLSFYQQLKIFSLHKAELIPYRIEKPLWIFVGGSVSKPREDDLSDVGNILVFLAGFVKDERASVERLQRLLSGKPGLVNKYGHEVFGNRFTWLLRQGYEAEELYTDILEVLFNTKVSGALLHADVLRGGNSKGEIGLRIGEAGYFGVINIGETSGLMKQLEHDRYNETIVSGSKDFGDSLFRDISKNESPLNILIGSRKFTEGWSSWRVSTMGLMNIGSGEGAQIIQLFGRGVRLKGLDFCLKRSSTLNIFDAHHPQPAWLKLLETLNIFGIQANYMEEFRKYIEEEELPGNDGENEPVEIVLPVIRNLGKHKVKILRVKNDYQFKKQVPYLHLQSPDQFALGLPVTLDLYPRLSAMASAGQPETSQAAVAETEIHFAPEHLAFFNWDEIYFRIQEFKNEKGWNNLNLDKETLRRVIENADWYNLSIPEQEMNFNQFGSVKRWQEIAITLLKRYCEKYYNRNKAAEEAKHLEYQWLDEYEAQAGDKGLIQEQYRILVEKSEEALIAQLQQLKDELPKLQADWKYSGFDALVFGQHFYKPLIYFKKTETVRMSPVPLNEGERDFVIDLRQYFEKEKNGFFSDKELLLLRNQSRGRGIGFFEANNFYPDFMLWVLHNGKQYMTFVDPHGLKYARGFGDEKIQLCRTIKNIEEKLSHQDSSIVLHSFIISVTAHSEIKWWTDSKDLEKFHEHHVYFQKEEWRTYVGELLSRVVNS